MQRCEAIESAARALLTLKKRKDTQGKDVVYRALQPSAWECLEKALNMPKKGDERWTD